MGGCLKPQSASASAPSGGAAQAAAPGQDPKFTADVLVFHFGADRTLQLLTITRSAEPYKDHAMLPGGDVAVGEGAEETAARVMQEATGLGGVFMVPIGSFQRPVGDVVISNAFFAFAPEAICKLDGNVAGPAEFTHVMPLASKQWGYGQAEIVATALTKASEQALDGTLEMCLPPEAAAASEPLKEELQNCLAGFLATGVLQGGEPAPHDYEAALLAQMATEGGEPAQGEAGQAAQGEAGQPAEGGPEQAPRPDQA